MKNMKVHNKINFFKNFKNKNPTCKIFYINFSYTKIIIIIIFFFFLNFIKKKSSLNNKKEKIHLKNNKNSYDQIGEKIFNKKKILNFTKLDQDFYGIQQKTSDFNHIHILFAFNNRYYLLASVTISNILKTSNPKTFIHIHIIAARGFKFKTMKKIFFIFHKIII